MANRARDGDQQRLWRSLAAPQTKPIPFVLKQGIFAPFSFSRMAEDEVEPFNQKFPFHS